jgi:hypothetical protein
MTRMENEWSPIQGGTSGLLYFLYFFVLLCTSLYFSVLLCTSWYFSVLLCTSWYFLVLLCTFVFRKYRSPLVPPWSYCKFTIEKRIYQSFHRKIKFRTDKMHSHSTQHGRKLRFWYEKVSNKKVHFWKIFSENQLGAHNKMHITLERYKLKIWASCSFVDLRLAVLIHSWKSKIPCSDWTWYIDFERPRLKILKKNCRESLLYVLRCVFISSFQRWKPKVSILSISKFIRKILRALLFWNG